MTCHDNIEPCVALHGKNPGLKGNSGEADLLVVEYSQRCSVYENVHVCLLWLPTYLPGSDT